MFVKNKKMKDENNENAEADLQKDEIVAELPPQEEEPAEEPSEEPRSDERDFNAELERAYCLGAGIDDDTLRRAKGILLDIAEAVNAGTFRPEMLQLAIRIINLDRTVEDARREGQEKKRRESAAEAASIPHLGGTKGIGNAASGNSIFDIARKA